MKELWVLAFFFLGHLAFADDTFVIVQGGALVLPDEKAKTANPVEMTSEVIAMDFGDKTYRTTVDFVFTNTGGTVTYQVGFPIRGESDASNSKADLVNRIDVKSFSTSINGLAVPWSFVASGNRRGILGWLLKEVTFEQNAVTPIQVSYDSPYGHQGLFASKAGYFFGTGSSWKNRISEIVLKVRNSSSSTLGPPSYPRITEVSYDSDFDYEFRLKDIKPGPQDEFTFSVYTGPSQKTPEGWNDFPDYDLNKTRYALARICTWSAEELKLLRNAIYALRGYRFKSPQLADFFQKQPWYQPSLDNVDARLTDYDKWNLAVIQKIETAQKSRGTLTLK